MVNSIFDTGAETRFFQRLVQLKPDSQRKWGTMSAAEMLCHCSDAILEILGEKKSVDRSNLMFKLFGKFMVLNLPFIRNSPTHPEYNPHKQGTKPGDFEADKAKLRELIHRLVNMPEKTAMPRHPLLGRMSHAQWGKLTARHLDHHFRQFGI